MKKQMRKTNVIIYVVRVISSIVLFNEIEKEQL